MSDTDEQQRLPEYVTHARRVAEAPRAGFAEAGVAWARVHPEVPHTQFQVWLPYDADVLNDPAVRQAEETKTVLFRVWDGDAAPGVSVTEVTLGAEGLAWTADDVTAAVAEFVRRLPG